MTLPQARLLLEGIFPQPKHQSRYRKLLEELIAKHTGQPLDKVAKDTDRDFIMTAEQAKDYGIVDDILTRPLGGDGEESDE